MHTHTHTYIHTPTHTLDNRQELAVVTFSWEISKMTA